MRLSVEEALARLPEGAEDITVEQFQHALGLTSPFPIFKWTYQTRITAKRLYRREDVIAFVENRLKPRPTKRPTARRQTSRKGDRRWYESAFLRKGIDLIAVTGATGHLNEDRRSLHALLDALLDDLGPAAYAAHVSEQVYDFGGELVPPQE